MDVAVPKRDDKTMELLAASPHLNQGSPFSGGKANPQREGKLGDREKDLERERYRERQQDLNGKGVREQEKDGWSHLRLWI